MGVYGNGVHSLHEQTRKIQMHSLPQFIWPHPWVKWCGCWHILNSLARDTVLHTHPALCQVLATISSYVPLISYETYLGGQESCRVAVSSCSAVTDKACTCPIRKAASADADILAFHMVVVTETNHHALLSVSIRSHKSMPIAGVPTFAVMQLPKVVCSSWVPTG